MNKRKIIEVVKFSLQKKIQNKWFVILNIVILLSTVAACNVQNIKNFMKNNNIDLFQDKISIEIIDENNIAKDKLKEKFKDMENITILDPTGTEYNKDNIPDDYVVIEVTPSSKYIVSTKVISKEGLDNYLYDDIITVLKEVRSERFAFESNISLERLEILNEDPDVERIMLGVDSANSGEKQLIKTISTFIIYFISIFIFSSIANEIAQEKVSKSIEYVLTSISAEEYLLAKIISVISFIVIQGIYTLIYYFIGNLINTLINFDVIVQAQAINMSVVFNNIDKDIMLYILTLVTYGILTLILLAIIQATISSRTTNMSEAGNTVSFLMSLTIVMYFVTLFVITPYTKMGIVLYIISCIPLVSNYFVPAIMIIGQATPLQIIASLLMLIVSIPITFKVCAKIFKNGVLDYSQKSKNKKVKKEKSFEEQENEKMLIATFRKFAFVIGLAIILWVALQLICSLVIGVIGRSLLNNVLSNVQINLIMLGVSSIVSIIIPVLFVSMYIEDEYKVKKQDMSIKTKGSIIAMSLFFIGILQIILAFIYPKIGLDYNVIDSMQYSNKEGILTSILYVICLAVIPGIFEELLFRKTIIDYSRKIGTTFAIIFSSLLFGIIHLNMGQGIFAFALGLLFAIIYIKTGSIKITMIIHFLNNRICSAYICF